MKAIHYVSPLITTAARSPRGLRPPWMLSSPTLQRRYSSLAEEKPAFSGAHVSNHTMGSSLRRYLEIKIHPAVNESDWKKCVVVGTHDRSSTSMLSPKEKRDKPFNWQRPTARLLDDSTLLIQCYPGQDHVWHYGAILSAHLRLIGRADAASNVYYRDVPPETTITALRRSNLSDLPPVDIAVVGLVHRLETLTAGGQWHGDSRTEFDWIIKNFPRGRVAFMGFRPSFWGSIAGDLVRVLAERNVKEVIYFGKLGSLTPGVRPNRWLATGNASTVDGRAVRWVNALDAVTSYKLVQRGVHYTLPSVLSETHDWLADAQREHSFVDPEVGCMAIAAVEKKIKFGYLHLISDNVAQKYSEDLSNEREAGVLEHRDRLYCHVNAILGRYMGTSDDDQHCMEGAAASITLT